MRRVNDDFYQALRNRMRERLRGATGKYAELLMAAPDLLHLLCKLAVDREVAARDRIKLVAVIAYFVLPLDLIPEAIAGPFGYADDIALTAYVLNQLINKTSPVLVLRHWAGDGDVLKLIRRILAVADQMVGSGLWRKIRGLGGYGSG
jgi:uncharacterized membrane protein YkvA (DUF1232 family)